MELLRKLKNLSPIDHKLSGFIIYCPSFQLLFLSLINQNIPLYGDIMGLLRMNSLQMVELVIFFHFIINIFTLAFIGLKSILYSNKKSIVEIFLLKFLKVKVHLLFIFFFSWNSLSFKYCPLLEIVIAGFNIAVMLGQLVVISYANISYRFQQQDFISRKNNSSIQFLSAIPIIICINYAGPLYAAGLGLIRVTFLLYSTAFSFENDVIQYCNYFSRCVLLTFCTIELFSQVTGFQILPKSNVVLLFMVFAITIYSADCLTKTLIYLIPKYHLKQTSFFLKHQSSNSLSDNEGSIQISEKEQESFILVLRILVKIYLAKHKSRSQKPRNSSADKLEEFDYWWQQYNQIIINHKIYCTKVNCICLSLQARSKQNQKISQTIYLQTLFRSLSKILSSKPPNITKLSIIEKYFYIELFQKPIKNYYELMKLKDIVKKREQILEVESLMMETRTLFQNLFIKEKVQNQNLSVGEVLDFQNSLKTIRIEMIGLSFQYKKFYDIFANNYVEMNILKDSSEKLTAIKSQFSHQLQTSMHNFSRNLQLLSYSYVYYRHFDQYTNNLPKIEKKMFMIQQLKHIETLIGNKNINRAAIDVFDPTYGAIKIDLVFRPGQIQSITKNLCELLGFNREQVQGHKVNKIMPYMFAKFHDKFLRNFIQNGSIVGLKKRQRIFYAKNFKKFIFPITVRLKMEYLTSQNFCASSLIKKTPTRSEFMLVNNYGKIQETSQKLYQILFQKGFKEETSKIKRLNIYKMLLSLNHFLKNPSDCDDRIYEGTITTAQSEQHLFSYFRYLELSTKLGKKSQNSMNSYRSEDKTNRSESSFVSGAQSFSGLLDSSESNQPTFNAEKCSTDMKESIRDYLKQVELQKIRAFKISYKFYDLVTIEFKSKVLQVVSIKEELTESLKQVELSKQMIQIGQLYDLGEDDLKKFRTNELKEALNMFKARQKAEIAKGLGGNFNFDLEQSNSESCNSSISGKGKVTQPGLQQMNSVTSSLKSDNEKTQRKESIISSFDLKTSIHPTLQSSLTTLMLLAALSLVIICIFSTTLKPDYKILQQDNIIISNFKTNFEFRLAVQELYHFYHPFGLEAPEFLVSKKHILTDSMKTQLQNSVSWISSSLSDDLYFDKITLTHADTGFQEERPILSTLGQIYSMFLMTQQQGQHLSDNYQTVRTHLQNLSNQEIQIVVKSSEMFRIKIHLIVALYGAVLIALVVIFVLINRRSIDKQQKTIDFLPFTDIKQVKNKIKFFDNFTEHLKQSEEFSLAQIENIEALSYAQRTDHTRNNSTLGKVSRIISAKLLNEQKPKETKQQANSKFIRIVRESSKILTLKNSLLLFLLAGICLVVIVQTEYFFSSAHEKFKAYLALKQSAMFIQSIPSKLILIYFINTDKIVHYEDMVPFPQSFYDSTENQNFKLRMELASSGVNNTQLADRINQHFNSHICDLIQCNEHQGTAQNQDIYYLTYRFVNAFHYLNKIQQKLSVLTQPKEEIIRWVNEGNVLQILKGIEHILELMKQNQEEITELFSNQVNAVAQMLLFFSLTLIPLLIVSLCFLRKKFLTFVYERLYSVQNVYKQFSWQILSDNTYALNYFENKVRNAKKA